MAHVAHLPVCGVDSIARGGIDAEHLSPAVCDVLLADTALVRQRQMRRVRGVHRRRGDHPHVLPGKTVGEGDHIGLLPQLRVLGSHLRHAFRGDVADNSVGACLPETVLPGLPDPGKMDPAVQHLHVGYAVTGLLIVFLGDQCIVHDLHRGEGKLPDRPVDFPGILRFGDPDGKVAVDVADGLQDLPCAGIQLLFGTGVQVHHVDHRGSETVRRILPCNVLLKGIYGIGPIPQTAADHEVLVALRVQAVESGTQLEIDHSVPAAHGKGIHVREQVLRTHAAGNERELRDRVRRAVIAHQAETGLPLMLSAVHISARKEQKAAVVRALQDPQAVFLIIAPEIRLRPAPEGKHAHTAVPVSVRKPEIPGGHKSSEPAFR